MHESRYWASLEADEAAKKVVSKVQDYPQASQFQAVADRQLRGYQYYYSISPDGIHLSSQVVRAGEAQQLASVTVNHTRSLVSTLLNLIVSNKVVFVPKATNIDSDTLRQCDLASAILEYFWSEKNIAAFAIEALEHALVLGEGFVLIDWVDDAGDPFAALGGKVVRSGAPVLRQVLPWDVIRDPSKPTWESCEWVVVRLRHNRWDLAEQYAPLPPPDPDGAVEVGMDEQAEEALYLREAILSCPRDVEVGQNKPALTTDDDSDDIWLYRFLHKKTYSMPKGRDLLMLPDGTVLEDLEIRGEQLPLHRLAAAEQMGSPYGYTPFWDVLGIQELLDSLQTAVASNQSTLATQCVVLEEGSDIPFDEIAGGMKAIYVPRGSTFKPDALQLLKTPAEVFKHIEELKSDQEKIVGLNAVVRGDLPAAELSGSAMSLLDTAALRQSSVLQGNYLRFVRGIGHDILHLFQTRAQAPQKIAIAGKANANLVTEGSFTANDLAGIKNVTVETANPMAQTPALRYEMAKELLTLMGPEKLPLEQLVAVMNSGQLKPVTESLTSELTLIRSENEALLAGENPPTTLLDDHRLHIREHRAQLANPQVRADPMLVKVFLDHIQGHAEALATAPPELLMMVGQEPLMPPMPPGPPPPGGGGGGDAGPPKPQPRGGPAQAGVPNNKSARQPAPPKPPKDPRTGEAHDPFAVGQPGPVTVPPAA